MDIEIDGLKIHQNKENGQIAVTFPDGGWNDNINEVSNILLYEILRVLTQEPALTIAEIAEDIVRIPLRKPDLPIETTRHPQSAISPKKGNH